MTVAYSNPQEVKISFRRLRGSPHLCGDEVNEGRGTTGTSQVYTGFGKCQKTKWRWSESAPYPVGPEQGRGEFSYRDAGDRNGGKKVFCLPNIVLYQFFSSKSDIKQCIGILFCDKWQKQHKYKQSWQQQTAGHHHANNNNIWPSTVTDCFHQLVC